MGRTRTTGCVARHRPGENCRTCARLRARKKRATIAPKTAAERKAIDARRGRKRDDAALDEAARRRAAEAAARAYVRRYLALGTLLPPPACERCGAAAASMSAPLGEPVTLAPWHPDPSKPREVAWLCAECRRRVRATREPLTLTWRWPGLPPEALRPRGRPRAAAVPCVNPAWIAAARAAAERITFSTDAAEAVFLGTFLEAAGESVAALYAHGARAAAGKTRWTPTGEAHLDVLLRAWVVREGARRSGEAEPYTVIPVPAWERRSRRDHAPLLPPAAAPSIEPRDPKELEARREAAFAKLTAADTEADAILARVQQALGSRGFLASGGEPSVGFDRQAKSDRFEDGEERL
jgi:hypothetical protein